MKLTKLKGNTYLIDGFAFSLLYDLGNGGCVLLDTPQGAEYGDFCALLKEHGLRPAAVILSHAHHDHSGCAKALRDDYGARLYASMGEASAMMTPTALSAYIAFVSPGSLDGSFLTNCVMDMDEIIMPRQSSVSAAGAEFQVLHSRGHSPDHICLKTPDGVLFCGDALISADEVARQKMTYTLGVADQIASARALSQQGAELAVVSHRGIIEGRDEFKDLCLLNIDHLETCVESLLEVIQARPMGLDEICAAYCLGLHMENVTLKNPQKALMVRRVAAAYIEYLVDTGRLDVHIRGGIFCYTRAGTGGAI